MEDNEEMEASVSRGNGWEVVSLAASTYDASPGPNLIDVTQDSQDKSGGVEDAQTLSAMFMSGHFVSLPSQNENLHGQLEYSEMHLEKGSDHDVSELVDEEGGNSNVMDEDNVVVEGLMSDKFPGNQIFHEEGNRFPVSSADLGYNLALGEEKNVYSTTESSSCHDVSITGKSNVFVENTGTNDSIEPLDQAAESPSPNSRKPVEGDKCDGSGLPCEAWWTRKVVSLYSHTSVYSSTKSSSCHDVPMSGKSNVVENMGTGDYSVEPLDQAVDSPFLNSWKPLEGDKYDGSGLPCEAWWKRKAVSLYAHRKEANTIWSMFIAAAVMGLVIIGHRWKDLQLKWQFCGNHERMGKMLGPVSRFKDVIVVGHRSDSLLHGSISGDH